ncbi:hypothetical protein [Microlunatus sp. Gsoil 973]|uniref:hypothetical protein n=1 Tax=Microlunatus sp. Gsoil 973 TaxID=2672569 RepID=UPI0018A86E25|nr:hypothetical protein [Microlunatus sp. Gsoil 973]
MITACTTYVIRVASHLDDHWSPRLGDATLTREADGTTMITVSVADQAQLHGVLIGLRDLGAVLLSLHIPDDAHRPGYDDRHGRVAGFGDDGSR